MDITIKFCGMCGGEGEADAVAAEILNRFGVTAKKVDVSRGVFDVLSGEEVIFSKAKEGRFPRTGEIYSRIKNSASRGGN